MLNGRYSAVIISLIAHALLLFLLLNMSTELPPEKQVTAPAIQSYLYTKKAIPEVKQEVKQEVKPTPQINKELKKKVIEHQAVKMPVTIPANTPPKEDLQKPVKENLKQVTKSPTATPETNPQILSEKLPKTPPEKKELAPIESPVIASNQKSVKKVNKIKKFSAYHQLNKLKNAMNKNMIQEDIYQYQQRKSASLMHETQETVLHSNMSVDVDKEKADRTTNYSAGMSITKNDNGTCSVTEDLSNVGMQGLSSTQFFDCGESKDEKYFKEHMKKVLKKLGK